MEYPTDNWIVNWAKNLVLILHDYLLVSAGDKSSIPFNPCVKWVFYFLHKKSTCSCLLHTMLLSLNNSKRKRYKLLLLNIFMFALLLDSNATLCVYDKDMPFCVLSSYATGCSMLSYMHYMLFFVFFAYKWLCHYMHV